jgi:ADP-ribose pyrophosphatase
MSEMRAAGQEVYARLMRGEVRKMDVKVLEKGPDVAKVPELRFLKLEHLNYTTGEGAAQITADWIRLNTDGGVIVLPILSPRELEIGGVKIDRKVESVVMIHKPQPPIEQYTVELVSGGVKPVDNSIKLAAAKRELLEEAGFSAERCTHLMDVAHAPFRMNVIDEVYLARGLQFVGREGDDAEERSIVPVILTMPEVVDLVWKSRIICAATVASITTYLLRQQQAAACWAPA